MARALLVAKDTMKRKEERIRQLEKKVETVVKENNKLRPKADFMDKIMDADERIDIGQSAKILNLPFGRNTLFQKLRDMGVFFKNKNEPKQEYVKRGYFVLKEKWIDRNNHDGFMVLKVLVTQKGLEFLANLFKVVEQPKEEAEVIWLIPTIMPSVTTGVISTPVQPRCSAPQLFNYYAGANSWFYD